jgi:putative ABC transport system permease protein
MILRLALRNLFHDRIRLAATLVGLVFSTSLVTIQLGLYAGSERMIATLIDHAQADLWVVPLETRSFENGATLPGHERYLALSTPGVAAATEIVVSFAEWRKPSGGVIPVVLVGAEPGAGGPAPWDIVEGSSAALATPDAVVVDRTYLSDLGLRRVGDEAEIFGLKARVAAVTRSIRSFTTLPYVFTALAGARAYLGLDRHRATYVLVRLRPGAGLDAVRSALAPKLRQAEVLTTAQFRRRTIGHWLFGTGAGSALIAGAGLGVLVGAVVVGQSLYAGTRDHLAEFATLRALGSSAGYIHRVILAQAVLCAAIGSASGALVGLLVVSFSAETAMPVVLTPSVSLLIVGITLLMCCGGAISAIMKIVRLDPASVFTR